MKSNKNRVEFITKLIFLWCFGVIAQENSIDTVELPVLQESVEDTAESIEPQTTVTDTVTPPELQSATDSVKTSTSPETIADTVKVFKQQDIIIESVESPKPPEIKSNKIIYSIDIKFLRVPLDYWFFYDSLNSRLVCDFYGSHIEKVP
ncbi:MAG: hypothetical protein Q4F84_06810, partial [Fibrobacter sp.]|nr:hypothetical protein [Fibrobacter sp.]